MLNGRNRPAFFREAVRAYFAGKFGSNTGQFVLPAADQEAVARVRPAIGISSEVLSQNTGRYLLTLAGQLAGNAVKYN